MKRLVRHIHRAARFARSGPGALRGAWLFLCAAAMVHAHDPYEITTIARLLPDAFALDVTMARSTALAIAAGGRESPTFDPAEFEKYRARLAACAPALFTLTAAGRPLALKSGDVALSIESDVEFHLVYPRPAHGPLRLAAPHVVALGSGFGNVFTIMGAPAPANSMLTAAENFFEILLPAPSPAPPGRASNTLPIVALLLAVGGGAWLWRRTAPA